MTRLWLQCAVPIGKHQYQYCHVSETESGAQISFTSLELFDSIGTLLITTLWHMLLITTQLATAQPGTAQLWDSFLLSCLQPEELGVDTWTTLFILPKTTIRLITPRCSHRSLNFLGYFIRKIFHHFACTWFQYNSFYTCSRHFTIWICQLNTFRYHVMV